MKNILSQIKISIVVVSLLSANVIMAQDDEFENYAFDDDKAQKTPYFALSVGGNAHFLFMDYNEINKKIGNSEIAKNLHFSGPIIGLGFDFFSAMSPLVNNARIGISYFSGKQTKEYDQHINILNPHDNEVYSLIMNHNRNLSVNNTSVHFDYAFVPFKSLAILPGIGLKWGSMTLEQYVTVLPRSWDTGAVLVAEPNLFNEKLEYSYVAIEPQISVEYAITGFLMLRAAGSYVLPFDNPFHSNVWTINGNNPYSDVPKSVKPQGFSATIGLYLGLFNY